MVNENPADSPFDSVGETVGDQTAQALELLANETRLEIIVALWDAIDRTPDLAEQDEPGLSFSTLYDRVGVQDSGQFNYHLDKLTGRFVDHADGTYTLTRLANRILTAIIAEGVTDPPSFTDEPIDSECALCGGSAVIDYIDGVLHVRCTNCEGTGGRPDDPPGLLMSVSRPPAGLTNRSPQEFYRAEIVTFRHDLVSYLEGVCPNCTGTVTATVYICDNHDSGDGSLCPHCHRRSKIRLTCVCDVCKSRFGTNVWLPIFTETAVVSFCYERGLDIHEVIDGSAWKDMYDAVETTVNSRDPLEISVTVELEGDRLTVTLDDDAQVIDIAETTS